MDVLNLDLGTALGAFAGSPAVWGWLLLGVVLGLLFGAMPGLTATAGVAIATPLTFGLGFDASMALLLGLYCAGYFAGSIPAILLNLPGAPGNAATALDGNALARMGEAERALVLATLASMIGGVVSTLILLFAAPLLARFALQFTAVEYASLGLFGLTCIAAVSGRSLGRGMIAALIGLYLGTVGSDPVEGTDRLTFGIPDLLGGIPLIPALIALFALTEVLSQIAGHGGGDLLPVQRRFPVSRWLTPLRREGWLIGRSSLVGTLVGILPGTGPTIASWLAYGDMARGRRSDDESLERREAGVLACESANNAVTGGAMVPLLTFGIPGDTVTAVLVGALLIQGIDPGPFFITQQGPLFAQILVILLAANLLMAVVTLALRRRLPALLSVPMRLLLPVVVVLCIAGSYAAGGSNFDVAFTAVAGLIGYVLLSLGLPIPPLVLGLVLGPIVERNLRDALTVHAMDWSVFVTRPISALLLLATAAALLLAWRRLSRPAG